MEEDFLHNSLKPLYKSYNEVIKPLIADIEARSQQFPLPLFNEIRAFNDHVAQCYWDDVSKADVKKEISKAERHIVRIVLDCYKYLTVFLNDRVVKFEKQTRRIDLTVINNGDFYSHYKKLREEAVAKVREAKQIESRDNQKSIPEFERSYNLYTELDSLISDNLVNINWARAKFSLRRFLKIVLWIIAAILSGLLSLLISCDWLFEMLKEAWLS